MKFYYNETGYNCKWTNKIKGSTWWNMEPAKLKIRMPISLYEKMLYDIKIKNDEVKNNEPITLKFKIHKEKNEKVGWGIYSSDESELWKITAILDRISYTSKFNDGTVTANIDFMVQYHKICDKSELRNILLSELI